MIVDPPKHCRARCLRSQVAPQRCLLSSDGAKIDKVFRWNKFFRKKLRKIYVKGATLTSNTVHFLTCLTTSKTVKDNTITKPKTNLIPIECGCAMGWFSLIFCSSCFLSIVPDFFVVSFTLNREWRITRFVGFALSSSRIMMSIVSSNLYWKLRQTVLLKTDVSHNSLLETFFVAHEATRQRSITNVHTLVSRWSMGKLWLGQNHDGRKRERCILLWVLLSDAAAHLSALSCVCQP